MLVKPKPGASPASSCLYKPVKDIATRLGLLLPNGEINPFYCTCTPLCLGGAGGEHGPECPVARYNGAGQYVNEVVLDLVCQAQQNGQGGGLTMAERFEAECVYHLQTSEKYTQVLAAVGRLAHLLPGLTHTNPDTQEAVSILLTHVAKAGVMWAAPLEEPENDFT